jgi:hypothetical protein
MAAEYSEQEKIHFGKIFPGTMFQRIVATILDCKPFKARVEEIVDARITEKFGCLFSQIVSDNKQDLSCLNSDTEYSIDKLSDEGKERLKLYLRNQIIQERDVLVRQREAEAAKIKKDQDDAAQNAAGQNLSPADMLAAVLKGVK